MPLPTSGAISFDNIRTEFSGSEAPISNYVKGEGLVANHAANLVIPTSNSNISLSSFYGAEKDFSCSLTEGGDPLGNYGQTATTYQTGFSLGTFGSINRSGIGISKNNTDQGSLGAFYQSFDYFDDGSGISLSGASLYFVAPGSANNVTGEWSDVVYDNGTEILTYDFAGAAFFFGFNYYIWDLLVEPYFGPIPFQTNNQTRPLKVIMS